MASKTDIANRALAILGESPVVDITENSVNAIRLAANIDLAIDEVLRDHAWNCATFRASLAAATPASTAEFAYAFQLPTDPFCLKAMYLVGTRSAWRVEGRLLVTNLAAPINLVFIGRPADIGELDTHTAVAIAYKLAEICAFYITGARTSVRDLAEAYESQLQRARETDAQEGMNRIPRFDRFIEGRESPGGDLR